MPRPRLRSGEREGLARIYRVIRGIAPAAGSEVSFTVAGGKVWTPLALTVQLVCSATVANRRPNLVYDDMADTFARVVTGTDVTASQTRTFSFLAELGDDVADATSTVIQGRLPALPLAAGMRIRTVTANLAAGDAYGLPILYVAEDELRGLAEEVARELVRTAQEAGVLVAPRESFAALEGAY